MASEQKTTDWPRLPPEASFRCPHCRQMQPRYTDQVWRTALLRDTPPEVWRAYAEDGIPLAKALTMEASYAC